MAGIGPWYDADTAACGSYRRYMDSLRPHALSAVGRPLAAVDGAVTALMALVYGIGSGELAYLHGYPALGGRRDRRRRGPSRGAAAALAAAVLALIAVGGGGGHCDRARPLLRRWPSPS